MRRKHIAIAILSVAMFALVGCFPESPQQVNARATLSALSEQFEDIQAGVAPESSMTMGEDLPDPDVSYTLMTGEDDTNLVFYGVGGDIDGVVNPTLTADPGQVVQITVINGHPVEHDLRIDEFNVSTGSLTLDGEQRVIKFRAEVEGVYQYYCTIPGHRAAGMEGLIQVGEAPLVLGAQGESIVKNPADLPGPIADREPELVNVELTAQEVVGQLAEGSTMTYFTFNGQVPGPFIRARVGDTIELTLNNETQSAFIHSIDLHAVNGPGGGAVYTSVEPGDSKTFTFKALTPGIFVYHCATPSIPHHISSGMYGLILIEPEGGLPEVDQEFYIMQGEIYTAEPFGTLGELTHDPVAMSYEQPEYFVFNGAAGALASDENALYAEVGETVRIYFGVGGPNKTSSFHVIGEIFDIVYPFGSMTSDPLTDVQTISVAPGGAWAVEFKLDVPGRYILVDHALSRLERGLVGFLYAEGEDNPEIFHEGPALP